MRKTNKTGTLITTATRLNTRLTTRTLELPAGCIGFLVQDGPDIRPVPLQPGHQLPATLAVTSPGAVFALNSDMATLRREHVRALYLDSRSRLIRRETISIGTLTSSLVHPREVFQPAVELSAHSLILVHCHPSGDPSPSPDDRALTRRLRQAGELLGIELVDHVIIARGGFVSLRERGEL